MTSGELEPEPDDTLELEPDNEPAPNVKAAVGATKAAFPETPAGAVEACPPGGKAAPAKPPVVMCVTQITATTPGTNGVRKKTDKRADNVLTPSSSADKSLTTNPPVVLVRGCKSVTLTAVTTPANQPVSWKVTANNNSNSPPGITNLKGGRMAKLSTNATGSFSVIATLGACKVVWNVVFVFVKVNVKSSSILRRNNKYADNGSGGGATSFRSGQFAAGQYPWEAKVKVKLIGGDTTKTLGVSKVELHLLHNGVADTLTGHFAPPPKGAVGKEKPGGGLPIRDSNGSADPFMDNPTTFTPDNVGVDREVWTADAPTGGFLTSHPKTGKALKTVSGVNGFKAAIASVSSDAPNTIMVHASTNWSANFSGTVDAAGVYTPRGAVTTKQKSYTLISPGTGGQDAQLAKFETFEPRFNDTTKTVVVYTPK